MSEPAPIRCTADLLDALHARKAELGLSNKFVDDICGLADGHTDKVLGPTRAKGASTFMIDVFLECFAVELVMRPNPEALARMQARWEQRVADKVVATQPVSKAIIARAKPAIFSEMGKRSAPARLLCLTVQQRSKIASKAARARWRKHKRKRIKAENTQDAA